MSQDSADATHDCPITGCIRRHLPFDVLMCTYHWGLVPAPLQRAVWLVLAAIVVVPLMWLIVSGAAL